MLMAISLLVFLAVNASAQQIMVKPFVAFPNEELRLFIEFPEQINEIKILAFYDQRNFSSCEKISCPIFENNSQMIENPLKEEYSIFIGNSPAGNYAVLLKFNDGSVKYTNFIVKQNYALYLIPILAVLVIALIGVEKNAFRL